MRHAGCRIKERIARIAQIKNLKEDLRLEL